MLCAGVEEDALQRLRQAGRHSVDMHDLPDPYDPHRNADHGEFVFRKMGSTPSGSCAEARLATVATVLRSCRAGRIGRSEPRIACGSG